jgi:nitrate reductase NapAB chaperone NapD
MRRLLHAPSERTLRIRFVLTAGIVIETLPGKATEIEHQLAVVPEVRIHTREADRLTGVCSVPPGETLSMFLDRLKRSTEGIVRIQTTFVRE